jgi:hypothetical protein
MLYKSNRTLCKLMVNKAHTIIPTFFGKTIFYFLIAIFTTSCLGRGYRMSEGIVVDHQTGKPMAGVLCRVLSGSMTQLTDSTGKFYVHNDRGYCSDRHPCKDIVVEFSKTGYQTKVLQSAGGEIRMRLPR